jgi:hypothetical protein
MSYPYDNSQYNYAPGAAPAYQYPQQGQQQSYDQNPPAIRNPFPAPPPARNAYGAQNAGYDPEQEALMAQWQSQYAPADVQAMRTQTSHQSVNARVQFPPPLPPLIARRQIPRRKSLSSAKVVARSGKTTLF